MKAYADLEQSKKLAEFLPLESADMHYYNDRLAVAYYKNDQEYYDKTLDRYIPAWSLAALLNILPSATLDTSDGHYCRVRCQQRCTEWYDNPVDACYEMILKLHELNLL